MANPALNWRYVGVRTFVSTIDASHDAVYSLGTSATYADGSARTPGTGSAWTWNREVSGVTVAAYGTPPTNALSFSYIVAGTLAAGAYTFLTPDTLTAGNVVVFGMNRNSGAYTTWTSATPFTNAGGFSGYWRGTRTFAAGLFDSVSMWESQEGCVLQYANAAGGSSSTIGFGALFDPLSTNTQNAESDGRLYTMWGGGSLTATSTSWASVAPPADSSAWSGATAANAAHCGTFAPGTNVMFGGAGVQTYRFGNFSPSATFTSTNGDIARVPLSAWNANSTFVGQSRQWYITKDATSRLTWQNGGTVIGYIWAASLSTQGDAVVLGY